jgi:hypothetical protein
VQVHSDFSVSAADAPQEEVNRRFFAIVTAPRPADT